MITATEALSLATKTIESGELTERAVTEALSAITSAAKQGGRSIFYSCKTGVDNEKFKESLESAGFEVVAEFFPMFTIRW